VVFAHDPDVGLNPASTMKVITAAAALDALGPAYKFVTTVSVDGPIRGDGTLDGNLYVEGTGDPTFVVEKLWKLVYDLELSGIERISGDVVFDEGHFTDEYALVGWTKQRDIERGPSYFPALGALSLNFNTVAMVVAPGEGVGKPARVRLETPAGEYVSVVSKVKTGPVSSKRSVQVKRELVESTMRFTLTGSVPSAAGASRYYRTVADPTSHYAAAFADMLEERNIEVGGRFKRGDAPSSTREILTLRSPPLASILMDMNKYSNNFMAEQVLRALGAAYTGGVGDTAGGLDAVSAYLERIGVDISTVRLVNGSGLTRQAEIPASVLTSVLVDMWRNPRIGQEFRTSLAIAGQDGTLWRRLTDDPGRLRGKTGTIDGVHCLAGYVLNEQGDEFAFAFMVNDISGGISSVKRLHDQFARAMFAADPAPGGVAEGTNE